jgi:hypothetical protein
VSEARITGTRTDKEEEMMRLLAVFMLAAALAAGGAAPASAAPTVTLVDTLGAATPATTFSFLGSGGWSLSANELLGPQFTLTAPTLITEIGGFLNNCNAVILGVPQCPTTMPLVVQIRPSVNGAPDPATVLGTFVLSHDNQPLVVSYESTTPNVVLPAGTYFALFGAQGGDFGLFLHTATIPFTYLSGITAFGFLNVLTGATRGSPGEFAALRILGILLPTSTDDCKDGGWETFGIFKNQGDCVSFVTTQGKRAPA